MRGNISFDKEGANPNKFRTELFMIDWQVLKPMPFFQGCPPRDLRRLARYCHQRYCRKFEQIHEAGAPSQHVCVIMKGEVVIQKATVPRDERARCNVVVLEGELFGFGEMMLNRYYTGAIALTDCVLLEIGKEDFVRHFMAIPVLREKILLWLSEIARILMNKLASGGLNELALYLYQRSEQSGKLVGAKIHIQEKMSQLEIASVLDLSREYVTRLFADLRAQKVVQFNRGFPIIDKAWLDKAVKDKDLADSIRYRTSPL